MYKKQKGRCKICNVKGDVYELGFTKRKSLVIDHCHSKGFVRGLLCAHCNLMIGHSRDNTETLKEAIRYLKQHQRKKK